MIKKSITAKLFLFIIILFLLQLVVQYTFQNYFISGFYENEKYLKINTQFEEAIVNFKEAKNLEEQIDVLERFTDETNEPIMVLNDYYEYHEATYQTSFERTLIVESDGEEYALVLNEALDPNSLFVIFDPIIIGEQLDIFGYELDNHFFPIGFEYEEVIVYTISFEEEELFIEDGYELIYSKAEIVNYDEIQISNNMLSKLEALTDYFFSEAFDEPISFESDLYEFIEDSLFVNGERLYFLTLISLQPINEVMTIQSRFQNYLFVGMTGLILIAAYFLSRIVSKPIIKISEAAGEIAALNFDVTCEELRSDEIGVLGKSINNLSASLKSKIEDLEKTNEKLEGEIEFERRQDKIRKEFVANVSHELKTPLGVIKSYSEGIQDGISKEKENYYLDVIVEEVGKMNILISDMLELSNLEGGIRKLDVEEINLKRMLQNLLRPYEAVIEKQKVNFKIHLEDVIVHVDVRKMESALSNLLSNAFRYLDDEKNIEIVLNHSEFFIRNSAVKIDEDEMTKLWDRFYRVEKSRTRSLGGNGLGLSIVKNILELHNLKYEIESTENEFLFKISFLS